MASSTSSQINQYLWGWGRLSTECRGLTQLFQMTDLVERAAQTEHSVVFILKTKNSVAYGAGAVAQVVKASICLVCTSLGCTTV